ncbi:family 1 glycosylhydrolase [Nakamurella sp. PAMC28650]|uniref:family 1 glycosylhydrolase n=1 Tax=Nakamurella sp. PAMC28650 TaxID=2762325 RepID=UPI00164D20CE|nr:family 1 glycosylhydrolase [Nakamurella sp. PAMC28650]QNK81336.1 family 1 glycosylhydrolase [Nakamurella sp. PAMC28650]
MPVADEFPHLPPDFEFGISSSALGIEGAALVDGREESIWDAIAAVPGRTADRTTGAVAVDHYHRYAGDVQLLTALGVDAYRFSISWPRVQPDGRGPGNAAGLDFYDRLVDALLAGGIDPWVTIYHWDLPLATMMRGGWLERDTADELGDLAALVAGRVGDRVHRWTTMADPLIHMAYGHALGVDAPGLTLLDGAFPVTHHLLLAHARVRDVLSANPSAFIGIANHHTVVRPASDSAADRAAAALYESYHNRQFADPILMGRYPRLLQPLVDQHRELIHAGDLAAIAAPLDFYGVDYFHPTTVAAAPENNTIPFALTVMPEVPVTEFDWPVHPASLTVLLRQLSRRYPRLPPLFVTENGAAYADRPDGGSDDERIAYLSGHLAAVDDAVAAGVDVRGYFHRGLTDAWEGTEGFTRQFGLVAVDPVGLERIPRASYEFFRKVISRHSARR